MPEKLLRTCAMCIVTTTRIAARRNAPTHTEGTHSRLPRVSLFHCLASTTPGRLGIHRRKFLPNFGFYNWPGLDAQCTSISNGPLILIAFQIHCGCRPMYLAGFTQEL
jgi:hypothetical protein